MDMHDTEGKPFKTVSLFGGGILRREQEPAHVSHPKTPEPPRYQLENPAMFVVVVGSLLTVLVAVFACAQP
jgi:hypothetical protein